MKLSDYINQLLEIEDIHGGDINIATASQTKLDILDLFELLDKLGIENSINFIMQEKIPLVIDGKSFILIQNQTCQYELIEITT